MAEINKITGVVVGQFGEAIQLTVVDNNGIAINVSSYTGTKNLYIRPPDALKTVTYTWSFVSDGTNGQIQFTPAASTEIDRPGTWKGQAVFKIGSSVVAKTVLFDMIVEEALA
jgi:hypothetical protein